MPPPLTQLRTLGDILTAQLPPEPRLMLAELVRRVRPNSDGDEYDLRELAASLNFLLEDAVPAASILKRFDYVTMVGQHTIRLVGSHPVSRAMSDLRVPQDVHADAVIRAREEGAEEAAKASAAEIAGLKERVEALLAEGERMSATGAPSESEAELRATVASLEERIAALVAENDRLAAGGIEQPEAGTEAAAFFAVAQDRLSVIQAHEKTIAELRTELAKAKAKKAPRKKKTQAASAKKAAQD